MQLDDHQIAIRERGYMDVLDLSMRVCVRYAAPLVLAHMIGILPMMAVNAWLLSGFSSLGLSEFPADYLWWMLMLVIWEIPLATAPATLYLGQALFSERPRPGTIVRHFLTSLPQMVLYQMIVRGMMVPLVITWFLPYAFWPYLNEVILLERNPLRSRKGRMSTTRRSWALHGAMVGDLFVRWMIAALISIALALSFWFSIWVLAGVLFAVDGSEGPGYWGYYPVALWITVGIFTVVRFLSYLDLRIRREGWEVELMIRAEHAKLQRQLV